MHTFQLECFMSVAEHLSFARAAEELNVTQPTVTHQIQSLENELGVKLLNRSTRTVSLTYEGEILLPEARSFTIRFRAMRDKFSSPHAKEVLPMHIACTSEPLMSLLPDSLYALASEYPTIHPILHKISMPQIAKAVEDGSADIAVGLKEALPKGSSICYTHLIHTPVVCLTDVTHPLSERESITLADLAAHNLIFYRSAECNSDIASLQIRLGAGKDLSEIFYCDDIASAITLARAGYGNTFLPRVFLPEILSDVRAIPITDCEPLSFGAYHKASCTDSQRSFIKLLHTTLLSRSPSQ